MKKIFLSVLVLLLPSAVLAGSQTFTSSGTFTVPAHSTLTVQVWGAGGGGGSAGGGGGGGGYAVRTFAQGVLTTGSSVSAVVGSGGSGGASWNSGSSGGTSSFSSVSASGGNGGIGLNGEGDSGGPSGGSGGSGSGGDANQTGSSGASGYGGAGGAGASGGAGGAGNYYGEGFAGTAPGGGGGGSGAGSTVVAGGSGAAGQVSITWTDPTPTCSVSVSPSSYNSPSSATLTWSSTNVNNWFYIQNVGYVSASGSTTVAPGATTAYSGSVSGSGGSATCGATLTVHPHCTWSGGTVTHGNSVTAYAADTVPYGSSCTSQSRTCTDGTLSGSYTYSSCAVDSPASCNLDGVTIDHGDSYTFYTLETAPAGETCTGSGGGTDYSQSRTCTDGELSGSSSYQYSTCGCTPATAYSCVDPDASVIRETATDASCDVTVTDTFTCTTPSFCSAGSAVCLDPTPSFNSSGGYSGHLEANPELVAKGATSELFWDVSNVSSCSISGNDESFSGTAAPSGGQATAEIFQQTTYTLTCTKLDDTTFSESTIVNVLPVFQER